MLPVLLAAVTGFISGLLLSIPVGPINLTILNEGARRGFRWAFLIGLGATAMEVIYCAMAFTGLASFFSKGMVKAGMELFSFGFILYLGLRLFLINSIPSTTRIGERVEERIDPHSAFMIGFVRVLGNVGVFVFWIILAANFISHEWVRPNAWDKIACVLGVALGCFLWFTGLAYAVSYGRRQFSERTLLRLEHISGVCLLILAFFHGLHILHQIKNHGYTKPPPAITRNDIHFR